MTSQSSPKYRSIIRLSYDGDTGSKTRNTFVPILKKAGFTNPKTGTWESPSCDIVTIHNQLKIIMEELANLTADEDSTFILDHIWIYIDKIVLPGANKSGGKK